VGLRADQAGVAAVVRVGSRPLSPRSLARRRPAPGCFASPSRGAGTGYSRPAPGTWPQHRRSGIYLEGRPPPGQPGTPPAGPFVPAESSRPLITTKARHAAASGTVETPGTEAAASPPGRPAFLSGARTDDPIGWVVPDVARMARVSPNHPGPAKPVSAARTGSAVQHESSPRRTGVSSRVSPCG